MTLDIITPLRLLTRHSPYFQLKGWYRVLGFSTSPPPQTAILLYLTRVRGTAVRLSPLKVSAVDVCALENIKIKERLVHSLDLDPETAVMHEALFVCSLDTLRQSVQRYSITP